jgi:hypothetical protein
MNIKFGTGQILDAKGNAPVFPNQVVPVRLIGVPPVKIVAVPNPSRPTFIHQEPGFLYFANNPSARTWVLTDHGGTVITFNVSAPSPGQTLEGRLLIYDAVGNLVASADNKDAYASLSINATNAKSVYPYDIYWNGSNGAGLKVAPGVYSALVYLTYTSPTATTHTKLWGSVGIAY